MRNRHQAHPVVFVAALLLTFAFALPAFAGGSNEAAASKEPLIWLTSVQGGRTPEEIPLFDQAVQKLTGIAVTMIKPPGSEANNKLTTMLASGEPLDIAYTNSGPFEALYAQNPAVFAPLTKYIEGSKVLWDPQVIQRSEWERIRRADGQIYAVFNKFEGGTMPIIRMDWLKKLNLPVPKTFDDYYNVLKAFTFNDPDGNGKNDTYGMAVGYTEYDMAGLFGAYGARRGFVKDASGKISSPYASPAVIPLYQWLTRLYNEGILEPNFVTNQSANFRDLFMTDKAGMTFYWAAWVGLFNQQVHAKNPDSPFDAEGIEPPAGPDGKRLLHAGDDGLMLVPSYSKRIADAFKVMEFWNTPAGNLLSSVGIEGYDYTVNNGVYALTDIGKQHAMDHGAPYPKSLKWKNPFGDPQGYANAADIVRKYAYLQWVTPNDSDWEKITRAEMAKIILGQQTPQQGIDAMNQQFKAAGYIN